MLLHRGYSLVLQRSDFKDDPKNQKCSGKNAEGGEHGKKHSFHSVPIGRCLFFQALAGTSGGHTARVALAIAAGVRIGIIARRRAVKT